MSENGFRLEASDREKSCFENGSCLPAEFRRVTISLAQRVQGAVLGTLGWHRVFWDLLFRHFWELLFGHFRAAQPAFGSYFLRCSGGAWEIMAFYNCGHAFACLPISSLYAGLPRAGTARGTPPRQVWPIFSMKFGFALGFGVAACSVLRSSRAAFP